MAVTTELAQPAPAGTNQVELIIGGMTCAACAARVQAKLNKLTGVTASVNLSTERAYVTAPATLPAAALIGVVEAVGYTAELARSEDPAEPDARDRETADAAAVRRLRRRLTVALVFFVPLTDLSMMLSIFPWTRFPGWQWVLVALATPVATWAAWPFHAAALRQARHLSSSMDTLVSLGILAACGWSVYAMFALDRGRKGPSGLDNLLHGSGGGLPGVARDDLLRYAGSVEQASEHAEDAELTDADGRPSRPPAWDWPWGRARTPPSSPPT